MQFFYGDLSVLGWQSNFGSLFCIHLSNLFIKTQTFEPSRFKQLLSFLALMFPYWRFARIRTQVYFFVFGRGYLFRLLFVILDRNIAIQKLFQLLCRERSLHWNNFNNYKNRNYSKPLKIRFHHQISGPHTRLHTWRIKGIRWWVG